MPPRPARDESSCQSRPQRHRQPRQLRVPRRARGRRTTTCPASVTMTRAGVTRVARSAIVRTSLCLLGVMGPDAWDNQSHAQNPPRTPAPIEPAGPARESACPGGNGIHISVTSSDSVTGVNRIIDQSRAMDTTIVFNIAERSWTRTNLAAAISVGLSDEARGGYMICAGVTALMPSATLTVRGARGRVHFQASLAELTNAIRSAPGAVSPQPRRL